jgi:hypothetical protein
MLRTGAQFGPPIVESEAVDGIYSVAVPIVLNAQRRDLNAAASILVQELPVKFEVIEIHFLSYFVIAIAINQMSWLVEIPREIEP